MPSTVTQLVSRGFIAQLAISGFTLLALVLLFSGSVGAQAPAWQWGLQSTNPTPTDNSSAWGNAVATDAAGHVYVGGAYTSPNASLNVTRQFGSAGTLGPRIGGFIAQASAAGQWNWVTAVVPIGANSRHDSFVSVTGVTVTAAGDIYATGYAEGISVQVGAQIQSLGAVGTGMYVARLNSAGVCQWIQLASGTFRTPTLAADPSTGGVVVADLYMNSVTIGGTTLPMGSFSRYNAVAVARLSASGQWVGTAAATGTANYIPGIVLAVGPTGQVAIAISLSQGDISFGSTILRTLTGVNDLFVVAQLSPTNQWQWAIGGSGSTNSGAFGAAYTANGALWVAGWGTNGTVVGSTTLMASGSTAAPGYAGFIGQLSATGQWGTVQKLEPTNGGFVGFAMLKLDGADNPVVLGSLRGYSGPAQTTLAGQALVSPTAGILLFIASLNSTGQLHYVASIPQTTLANGLSINGIELDNAGGMYFTGGLSGGLTLGSTTLMGSNSGLAITDPFGDVILGRLGNAFALATRPAVSPSPVTCFPNPAHNQATLHFPVAFETSTAVLLDALGRTARTYSVPAAATSAALDLRGLAPGLYVVRCGTASGKLVVE